MNSFALAAGTCVSVSGEKAPGEPRIRQPGFPGNPCIPEKCRISEVVFLFSEHAECLQDEQSVISLTSAAAPSEALQAAPRGWSLGMG